MRRRWRRGCISLCRRRQSGQVGTIVEEWQPGVYEVEFADTNGNTYGVIALRTDQLMTLYFHPNSARLEV
ncbi:MAG: DUF4926 domain-containing protein [Chloroflexi bacterium]|nr:DUF4926 domain-containing protein [Chloroflexota bacterium]